MGFWGKILTLAGYLDLVTDAHGLAVVRLLAHAVTEALITKVLEVGHGCKSVGRAGQLCLGSGWRERSDG